jgi:hypothetical protein
MRPEDRETILRCVGAVMKENLATVRAELDVLKAQIVSMQSQIARLEVGGSDGSKSTSLADTYAGVYEVGQAYERGATCTHGGSLWLAMAPTTTRPGDEGSHWKLVCKRGANGRPR